MKPNNKPNRSLPPEWMCIIRIIATVTLTALVSCQDPVLGRTLMVEVVKSLMI